MRKNEVPELSGTYYLIDDIWGVSEASITFSGDNFTLLVDGEKPEGKMRYNSATTGAYEDGSRQRRNSYQTRVKYIQKQGG